MRWTRPKAIGILFLLTSFGLWTPMGPHQATESVAHADSEVVLDGIDVSHWQGAINWAQVKASGKVFAFCKATEGTGFLDSRFAYNWAQMDLHGLIRGAYHYGRPGSSAVNQATYFYNTVRPRAGDLQMTLDLETTDGRTPAQVWTWTQDFINRIKALTGRPGIIYCGYYFWRDSVGNPTNNLNCPLWIACWCSNPQIPPAWPYWTFWQHSSTGSVPGVNGNCDLDRFNGSMTNLRKLTLPRFNATATGQTPVRP